MCNKFRSGEVYIRVGFASDDINFPRLCQYFAKDNNYTRARARERDCGMSNLRVYSVTSSLRNVGLFFIQTHLSSKFVKRFVQIEHSAPFANVSCPSLRYRRYSASGLFRRRRGNVGGSSILGVTTEILLKKKNVLLLRCTNDRGNYDVKIKRKEIYTLIFLNSNKNVFYCNI